MISIRFYFRLTSSYSKKCRIYSNIPLFTLFLLPQVIIIIFFFAFSVAVATSKPPVVDFPFTKINKTLTKVETESWNVHTFVHSFIYSKKVEYLLTKICQFYTKKRYPLTLGGGRKGGKVLLKRLVVVLRFIFVTKIRWGINIILMKAK